MPQIKIENKKLIIALGPLEKFFALRSGISVSISSIRSVEVDPTAVPWKLGFRAPGTFFPWLIAAGTYWKPKNKQFAYWKKGETPVVIELQGEKFDSLIIGTQDAAVLKSLIDSAIALQK